MLRNTGRWFMSPLFDRKNKISKSCKNCMTKIVNHFMHTNDFWHFATIFSFFSIVFCMFHYLLFYRFSYLHANYYVTFTFHIFKWKKEQLNAHIIKTKKKNKKVIVVNFVNWTNSIKKLKWILKIKLIVVNYFVFNKQLRLDRR